MRLGIQAALKQYNILTGHWDLYIAMIAHGHSILREKGVLAYIVANPLMKEKYATAAREFLLSEMKILSVLAFNDVNVFDGVSRRTMVLVARKEKSHDYTIAIYENRYYGSFESRIVEIAKMRSNLWLDNERHVFVLSTNKKNEQLLRKLEVESNKIGNFFYVNYGAQVCSKVPGKFKKSHVVFESPKGKSKRFFEGKDIHRWFVRSRELFLDYRKNEMYGPRVPELFECEKIVIRYVSDKNHRIAAALDKTGRYCDHCVVIIVPFSVVENTNLRSQWVDFEKLSTKLDLRYVLAFLLSNVEAFYFRNKYATESLQGNTSQTYPASIRALIIKNVKPEIQYPIITCVNKILSLFSKNNYENNPVLQAKISDLEIAFNKLIYELYELTPEEINLIEECT